MSIWGKVLAILNVLAAGAFVYLAMLDYSQRKTWAYTELQYSIAHEGVPVDATVTDLDGRKVVEDVDERMLRRLQQGGQPLKTQEEEVKRVQGQLQQQLESAEGPVIKDPDVLKVLELLRSQPPAGASPDDVTVRALFAQAIKNPNEVPAALQEPVKTLQQKVSKVQKLAWMLQPFAQTFGRLDGLNRLTAGGLPLPNVHLVFDNEFEKQLTARRLKHAAQKNRKPEDLLRDQDELVTLVLEKLQNELDAEFSSTLQKKDPGEKHQAIAHLLFCTSQTLANQEEEAFKPGEKGGVLFARAFAQMLVVVGLDAAVRELDGAAAILERMVYEVERAIDQDRVLFTQEHERRLHLIGTLKEMYTRVSNEHKAKVLEKNRQEQVIEAQKANIDRVQKELRLAEDETQKQLGQQAERERQIFDMHKALRDATAKNRELEKKLRELEEKISPKGEAQ